MPTIFDFKYSFYFAELLKIMHDDWKITLLNVPTWKKKSSVFLQAYSMFFILFFIRPYPIINQRLSSAIRDSLRKNDVNIYILAMVKQIWNIYRPTLNFAKSKSRIEPIVQCQTIINVGVLVHIVLPLLDPFIADYICISDAFY